MEKNIIKNHPVLFGFIGFVALTLPQTISSYLDLWQRFKDANVHINWFQWVLPILPILGVGLFAILLWQTRKSTSRINLSSSFTDNKKKESSESLLEKYIKDDKSNLGKRFYLRDYSWSFDNLKQTDSFMEMTVTIINSSVFSISIEGVKGRFWIENQECAYNAEMEGQCRIPRGESRNIRIKQHLSQEMMNLILIHSMRKQAIRISLKLCKTIVQPEITGENSEPIYISFTFEQDVPMPELKWE